MGWMAGSDVVLDGGECHDGRVRSEPELTISRLYFVLSTSFHGRLESGRRGRICMLKAPRSIPRLVTEGRDGPFITK